MCKTQAPRTLLFFFFERNANTSRSSRHALCCSQRSRNSRTMFRVTSCRQGERKTKKQKKNNAGSNPRTDSLTQPRTENQICRKRAPFLFSARFSADWCHFRRARKRTIAPKNGRLQPRHPSVGTTHVSTLTRSHTNTHKAYVHSSAATPDVVTTHHSKQRLRKQSLRQLGNKLDSEPGEENA